MAISETDHYEAIGVRVCVCVCVFVCAIDSTSEHDARVIDTKSDRDKLTV